jgi:hypothetical protein
MGQKGKEAKWKGQRTKETVLRLPLTPTLSPRERGRCLFPLGAK